MKVRKLAKTEIIEWVMLYIMFILHGTNIISYVEMGTLLPLTILAIVLYFSLGIQLSKKLFFTFSILLINHIITGFISGASVSEGFNFTGWMLMIFVVLTVIWLYEIDDDVMTKFLKMVYFFAVISLVCYALSMLGLGNILTSVFKTYSSGMGTVAGKWLYVYNIKNPERNSGIFTEPGIYQAVLIMCIYTVLFLRERILLTDKQCIQYLIVFLITLITTRSAAGYIGLFIISIGVLLKHKEKRDYAIVAVMGCGMVFLIFNYYTQGSDSILEQYFWGKLVETQERSLELSSGGARLLAMQMGIQAALIHPFGIGYLNWQNLLKSIYGRQFGTGNALFTQLGTRGFIAFFISLYLAIEPAVRRRKGALELIIFIILFLYITTAQSQILYPVIMLVAYLPGRCYGTVEAIVCGGGNTL